MNIYTQTGSRSILGPFLAQPQHVHENQEKQK